MRENDLKVLPVVDDDGTLLGDVQLKSLLKLRKEHNPSLDDALRTEVLSVTEEAILEDILPLTTRTNSPIWVVDSHRKLKGVVPLPSLIAEVTGKNPEEIDSIIQNAIEL